MVFFIPHLPSRTMNAVPKVHSRTVFGVIPRNICSLSDNTDPSF